MRSYECFIPRTMRLSNKFLMQGYVKKRLRSSVRQFYGRYGDLIKQYEVPLSRMLHDILDDDHIQWHPPLIRHYINFWSCNWSRAYYRIWLFTKLREVSIERLQRVRHANRGRLLLRTPNPIPFEMCICSAYWDQLNPKLITLHQFVTFKPVLKLLPNKGLYRASVTGVPCIWSKLTPPDTRSCPTLGLTIVLMLRPISHYLSCFRTFEFRTSLDTSAMLRLLSF